MKRDRLKNVIVKMLIIILFIILFVFLLKKQGINNSSESERPKVSVIIPVYAISPDSDRFLIECLDSIVNQTLKEIEIICIDDKSPKQVGGKDLDLGKILDYYANKDNRVKVVHKIKNGGVSAARNDGLNISKGEYITFCDDDDFIHPQTYEYAYKYAKNDDVDLLNFDAMFFKDFKDIDTNSVNFYDTSLVSLDEYTTNHWCVWNCLFKSDLINSTGIKFVSREIWEEDFCFLLEFLPYTKKIKKIDSILYYHRNHPDSLSSSEISLDWLISSKIEMIKYIANLHGNESSIKKKSGLLSLIIHSPVVKGLIRYNCFHETLDALGKNLYNENIISQCPKDVQQTIKEIEKASEKQNKKVA